MKIEDKLDLVKIEITAGGKQIEITTNILVEITVNKWINKISRANVRLVFSATPIADAYTYCEDNSFKPGSDIEIKAAYMDETTTKSIFKGMIVKLGLSRDRNQAVALELECAHKAIKATTARKTASHTGTDTAIINSVLGTYSITKTVASMTTQHTDLIQYNATDWDFVLSRAQANGMIVLTNTDTLEIEEPTLSGTEVVEVEDRKGLLAFSTHIDGTNQFSSVDAKTWDTKTQKSLKSSSGSVTASLGGDITPSSLTSTFNSANYQLLASSQMSSNELQTWASSLLKLSRMNFLQGSVTITGNATAECGKLIKISGLNSRFNGNGLIGAVQHQLTTHDWITELELGYDFNIYSDATPTYRAPGAGGLLPEITTLHIGKVDSIGSDSEGLYRVKVKFGPLSDDNKTVMARLANQYASSECGMVFMPEKDDEVVLGFIDNDPRNAVILGSLYSSTNKMPETIDSQNNIKAIVTKQKLKLHFDEQGKIIKVETPKGVKITLDDAGTLELTDGKNTVKLSSSGVDITSNSALNIKANGKITIDGKGGIDLKTTANLNIEGTIAKINAKGTLTIQASGMAKLGSSGILQIQGSLVKIN